MEVIEKVAIDRVYLKSNLPKQEVGPLIDLTMTTRNRNLFHSKLAEMGYCVGEGKKSLTDDGRAGTTFSIYSWLMAEDLVKMLEQFQHSY